MAKVVIRKAEMARFRAALGLAVLNFGHAVEAAAKRETPVRGGYRSFLTTKQTKAGSSGEIPIGANNGSVLIGGTLRRSIHTAAFVDGKPVAGSGQADENGETIPDYAPAKGILVVVGTNSTYGAFVEIGTVKMAERPFLGPAWDQESKRITSLMRPVMKQRGF